MNKVVFFTYALVARCDKRIKEFIQEGYEVEVYCFENKSNKALDFDTPYKKNILASYPQRVSFFTRFIRFTPMILRTIAKYDKKETLFYFFSLNVAPAVFFQKGITFIYEESDMLFDRSRIPIIRWMFEKINRKVIELSLITVFTSEGFSMYYFKGTPPSNIIIIPNKLSNEIMNFISSIEKRPIDFDRLKLGFVGFIRYESLFDFASIIATYFPQHEFHFYGQSLHEEEGSINELKKYDNVFFHGEFKSPDDLPEIYSKIDFVVATYDAKGTNPRYAEPNKLYESIFFRTPIIVSSGTFLADKVAEKGIGFSVSPSSSEDIIQKINSINFKNYESFSKALHNIPQSEAINDSRELFKRLKIN